MNREDLQPYLKLSGGIAVLVAVAVALYFLFGSDTAASKQAARDPQAFYTVDDGKTLFTDLSSRIPPFDHEGRPAVAAIVTSPDNGKTRSVAYLQRYNEQAHKIISSPNGAKAPRTAGVEVKKVGLNEKWVPFNSKPGIDIVRSVTQPRLDP